MRMSVVLKVFYNHYKKIVAFRDDTIVSFMLFTIIYVEIQKAGPGPTTMSK